MADVLLLCLLWLVGPSSVKETDPIQKKEPTSMKIFRLCFNKIAAQKIGFPYLVEAWINVHILSYL